MFRLIILYFFCNHFLWTKKVDIRKSS